MGKKWIEIQLDSSFPIYLWGCFIQYFSPMYIYIYTNKMSCGVILSSIIFPQSTAGLVRLCDVQKRSTFTCPPLRKGNKKGIDNIATPRPCVKKSQLLFVVEGLFTFFPISWIYVYEVDFNQYEEESHCIDGGHNEYERVEQKLISSNVP